MDREIILKTIELRARQKEFFKGRSKTVLSECRRLESELDALLQRWQRAHNEGRIAEQGNLLESANRRGAAMTTPTPPPATDAAVELVKELWEAAKEYRDAYHDGGANDSADERYQYSIGGIHRVATGIRTLTAKLAEAELSILTSATIAELQFNNVTHQLTAERTAREAAEAELAEVYKAHVSRDQEAKLLREALTHHATSYVLDGKDGSRYFRCRICDATGPSLYEIEHQHLCALAQPATDIDHHITSGVLANFKAASAGVDAVLAQPAPDSGPATATQAAIDADILRTKLGVAPDSGEQVTA